MQHNEPAIDLRDLPDAVQEEIDGYPEHLIFFVLSNARGYELHTVEPHLYELLQAQGGMGEGWMRVRMLSEEGDA